VYLFWKVILKRCITPTVYKVPLKNLEGNLRDLKLLKMNITHAIEEVKERTLRKVARNMEKCVDKCNEMNENHFEHLL
jgi:hypothetical protein